MKIEYWSEFCWT